MKIHLAQKSDYPFIKQLWQYSFGFSRPFLQWSLDNMLSAMQVYIAEENGEEKAAAAAIPMSISNADKTVRASYMCGCTTAPEYRGQGIMRNLVSTYLEQTAGAGIPLSLCVPFDYKTLERYGWRTAYMYKQYTLAPQSIPPYTVKGSIKIAALEQRPITELSAVYAKFVQKLNGYSKRSTDEWKRILDDLIVNFGGNCVVYYDKSGTPAGYMLYLIHGSEMRVYEMAYTSKTASDSMYAFMKNHSSQIKEITIKLPENDISHLDFCDSRNAVTLCPFVSARITSVTAALAYVCEKAENDVRIQVIDRMVPSNNAVFAVSRNGVVRTDAQPDVTIDIGTLTQLFMGFISVEEAEYMNMAAGNTDMLKPLFEKKCNYINMLIM